jgi:hypothetical protein
VKSSTLGFLLLFVILATPLYGQKDTQPDRLAFPHTDDRFDTILQTHNKGATQSVDPAQLKREAQELLELTQALQTDIAHVNQGLLPKETIERLKRIEKVCKRLRGEVGP